MKKEIVTSRAVRAPVADFPVATRADHLLFISGQLGLDDETGLPLESYRALGRRPFPALGLMAPDSWEEAFVAQASRMYENLDALFSEHGSDKSNLLFYSIYVRDMRNFPVIVRTRSALFEGRVAPPSTASQVPGLLYPGALVYFDPVAMIPNPAQQLARSVLTARCLDQGPLSNYELGTRVGAHTFYAGVVGAHPETGLIVHGANELTDAEWQRPAGGLAERRMREPVSAQTFTIYKLFRTMLEEHGLNFADLLKINIYLRSMADLPEMERLANEFFGTARPAAGIIAVESLARRDFLIEIEGIAASRGAVTRLAGNAGDWAPYAQATRGDGLIFVTATPGVRGADAVVVAGTGDLPGDAQGLVQRAIAGLRIELASQRAAAAQTYLALDRIRTALGRLDSRLSNLLKITVYLRDMRDFAFVHAVARAMLADDPPAISVLAVADLPLAAARVEIEAVAV